MMGPKNNKDAEGRGIDEGNGEENQKDKPYKTGMICVIAFRSYLPSRSRRSRKRDLEIVQVDLPWARVTHGFFLRYVVKTGINFH